MQRALRLAALHFTPQTAQHIVGGSLHEDNLLHPWIKGGWMHKQR